jgi:Calcineurin-like phosphoesterase
MLPGARRSLGLARCCLSPALLILACSTGTRENRPEQAVGSQEPSNVSSAGSVADSGNATASTSGMASTSAAPAVTGSTTASAVPSPYSGVVGAEGQELFGTPLTFAPTESGFGLNVILGKGEPASLRARARVAGEQEFGETLAPSVRSADVAEWRWQGLNAGTRYEYQVTSGEDEALVVMFEGEVVTRRAVGTPFSFAMMADSHIGANLEYTNQGSPTVFTEIARQIGEAKPDFLLNLGDLLDYHQFGFNDPPPDASIARNAYRNYRSLIGPAAESVAHFGVVGNWDGENGDFTAEEIARSRDQRLLYLPNPSPETNPEGGSVDQDYYAFTWGDALFVTLNVMTYTPTSHLLSGTDPGLPDDWTLGTEQLEWLRQTLEQSTAKWKFTFIHHTVGGNAGDEMNSAYGRGGGRAANVGEQAMIHQLLIANGVQVFFYAHDHVFTDMVVDGVHYTAPGAAGAPWTFTTAETGYTQYWSESGWVRVDVTPNTVHVAFNSIEGATLYDYWLDGEPPDGGDGGDASDTGVVLEVGTPVDGAADADQ